LLFNDAFLHPILAYPPSSNQLFWITFQERREKAEKRNILAFLVLKTEGGVQDDREEKKGADRANK